MTVRIIDRATGAIVGVLAIFVVALLAGVVNAGPLDPGSAPGSTPGVRLPGTPITSLPTTITQPGHYYLNGNLIGPPTFNGIIIESDDVTVDLGGFRMIGTGGSANGIFASLPVRNLTIRNGSVVDWDAAGIEVSNAREAVIEDVHVSASGDSGIITDFGARISRCTVAQNGGNGIDAGARNIITDCTATENGSTGISADTNSVLERVTSHDNGEGIFVDTHSRLSDCTANGNDAFGIRVLDNSTVDGCTASNNIVGTGIEGMGLSIVVRSSTAFNNGGNGISVGDSGVIESSTAQGNTLAGIRGAGGAVVRGSTARNNDQAGFYVGSASLVEDNLAVANGGTTFAGFLTDGNASHFEGNVAVSNDKGFEMIGGFNTVIGNTARSNGAAGLTDEFILPITTVAGPTIDGGVGVDNATNPYANFAP